MNISFQKAVKNPGVDSVIIKALELNMSNVFSFDEEAFISDFNKDVTISTSDFTEPMIDPLENKDVNLNLDISSKTPTSVSSSLKVPTSKPSKSMPRRRSSVYRRLSIKSISSLHHDTQELSIPLDYDIEGSDEEPFPTTNSIEVKSNHRVLSDFVPIKVLGQGAYGKVHLVQDKHTKKLFAQKQLKKPTIEIHQPEGNAHTNHVKRTILERRILTNITHHPNIVKLFYALQDQDKFYLILEYIPGGELFHHLTSSSNSLGNVFKEDDVSFYSAQMALGLRHLHKLGIVYRDLKPENCLLNSAGHLVLTDFGLSKTIGSGHENDDSCTSIIGTPEYMAPEILRGEEYDYAVDWWSLGCVIYDMMTGKPPFTGNSHKVIQDKIIKNKLKLPFYFSLDAKDLLNKLLNKNKTKRLAVDDKWDTFTNHRFFRKLDWKALEAQDNSIVSPPILPIITDPILAENFSDEFTSLNISDYNINQSTSIDINNTNNNSNEQLFKGFSYTASTSYLDKFYDRA